MEHERQQIETTPQQALRQHPTALVVVSDLATAAAAILAVAGLSESRVALADVAPPLLAWAVALAAAGAWSAPTRPTSVRAVLRAAVAMALGCWLFGATIAPSVPSELQAGLVGALAVGACLPRLLTATRPLRVALTGDLDDLRALAAEVAADPHGRWVVSAVSVPVDDSLAEPDRGDPELAEVPMWLGAEAVVDAACATGASAVVIAPGRALDPSSVRRICWRAHEAGLDVFVGTGLLDVAPSRIQHVSAGRVGLAKVHTRVGRSTARRAKHLTDRVLASLALVALLPVLLAIAVAVRCTSPGGALYRQRRTGRGGSAFTMYKFRTMHTDADRLVTQLSDRNDCDGVLFKMREDPRITRIGRVLRRYSLDELPQLINVARGEMSLVGPRPALPHEVAQYDHDPRRRLAVKPGLTGLWQVSGRSDLSWEDSVRLDLHYVDNWSWRLDLAILARTVGAVLSQRGAY